MWCGTLVAAKILKDSSAIALGDFRAEVSVLQKVHHPNAVQVRLPPLLPPGKPPAQAPGNALLSACACASME